MSHLAITNITAPTKLDARARDDRSVTQSIAIRAPEATEPNHPNPPSSVTAILIGERVDADDLAQIPTRTDGLVHAALPWVREY